MTGGTTSKTWLRSIAAYDRTRSGVVTDGAIFTLKLETVQASLAGIEWIASPDDWRSAALVLAHVNRDGFSSWSHCNALPATRQLVIFLTGGDGFPVRNYTHFSIVAGRRRRVALFVRDMKEIARESFWRALGAARWHDIEAIRTGQAPLALRRPFSWRA